MGNFEFEVVVNHIQDLRSRNKDIDSCFEQLQKKGEVVLFGGAVRDILCGITPRDYDLVVAAECKSIEMALSSFPYRKNSFGGYKTSINGFCFDIWNIDNTWAFKEKSLDIEASFENLNRTVFFNVDSITAHLYSRKLVGDQFLEAINSKCLDIVMEPNPHPALCVMRALVLQSKYKLSASCRLKGYIADWISATLDPISELTSIQKSHYGKEYLCENGIKSAVSQYCEV